jgi:hypothetical protein
MLVHLAAELDEWRKFGIVTVLGSLKCGRKLVKERLQDLGGLGHDRRVRG